MKLTKEYSYGKYFTLFSNGSLHTLCCLYFLKHIKNHTAITTENGTHLLCLTATKAESD